MTQPIDSIGQQQIDFLERRRTLYLPIAGGWPPNIDDGKQLREIQTLILKDIESTQLFIEKNPDIVEGREIYADLLRMAHNIDIPGAAPKADVLLQEILLHNPQSYAATLSLAALYVTTNADFAPKAEQLFCRALELRPNSPDPSIYQGLGFALLQQGKTEQAIENFQEYLRLVPSDKQIPELVEKLITGEKPERIHVPLAEKSSKPWWKLW